MACANVSDESVQPEAALIDNTKLKTDFWDIWSHWVISTRTRLDVLSNTETSRSQCNCKLRGWTRDIQHLRNQHSHQLEFLVFPEPCKCNLGEAKQRHSRSPRLLLLTRHCRDSWRKNELGSVGGTCRGSMPLSRHSTFQLVNMPRPPSICCWQRSCRTIRLGRFNRKFSSKIERNIRKDSSTCWS